MYAHDFKGIPHPGDALFISCKYPVSPDFAPFGREIEASSAVGLHPIAECLPARL